MKSIFTLLICFFMFLGLFAQVPSSFNYQAVLRDSKGNVKASQKVQLTIEILQGNTSGLPIYKETFSTETNPLGLVNLSIGSKNPIAFDNIDWANGPFFLKIILDGTEMGISQLQSVPYALYAKTSGSNAVLTAGNGISISDNEIANTAPDIPITIAGENGILVEGNYPEFKISANLSSGSDVVKINSENYSTISIKDGDLVKIEGTIDLQQELDMDVKGITVFGGNLSGGGSQVFAVGRNSLVQGTSFTDIDIDCKDITFVNCSFSGNCPRLGYDCRFLNCTFNGINTTTDYLVGQIEHSEIQYCKFPRIYSITNSTISNSEIGDNQDFGISFVNFCKLSNTQIFSNSSEFVFTGNRCSKSKISIGSPTSSPSRIMISLNSFSNLLEGSTEAIRIDPSYSGYKIWNITGNSFSIQTSDPQAISIEGTEGNASYSLLNIQNNHFFKCNKTLNYSTDMNVSYSNNVGIRSEHPFISSNLRVKANESF
jgi:hypothetical protein